MNIISIVIIICVSVVALIGIWAMTRIKKGK